jgi:serine/threonine protein kinase
MAFEGKQFSRYRILQLIGKGGMGEVYLAEDVQVRRQVAAKFIRVEVVQADKEAVSGMFRLFWREATTIAQLDHPHILPLYDHGTLSLTFCTEYFSPFVQRRRAPPSAIITKSRAEEPNAWAILFLLSEFSRALSFPSRQNEGLITGKRAARMKWNGDEPFVSVKESVLCWQMNRMSNRLQ